MRTKSLLILMACVPVLWCASCSEDNKDVPPPPEPADGPVLLQGSGTRKFLQLVKAMDPVRALDWGVLDVPGDEYAEIKAFTDELVGSSAGEEAYRKIFDWVGANVTHGNPEGNDPYTVFKTGVAVCQGFANLLKTMCLSQGIPCVGVNGVMYPGSWAEQGHAWNYVWTGGRWIVSDPTGGRDWDMEADVDEYSYEVEPYFTDIVLAEDDNFAYGYYRGLNVKEIRSAADTVVVPPAAMGFCVTSCNPSALPPSVKVVELNAYVDYLGDRGSEGLRPSFLGANLEAILVAEGNKSMESHHGVLYYKDSDLPGIVPGAMRAVRLKSAAFGKNEAVCFHDSVEEIRFAEGTPSIAAAAVEMCPRLKRVYVPAATVVEEYAFPDGVEIIRY